MLIPFHDLFKRHGISCKSALHIGANFGQEAQAYHTLGIDQVIWVEALEEVWEVLRSSVDCYPKDKALLACLSNKDGETVPFNVANNEYQSSSLLAFGTHAIEHPTTKFISVRHLTTIRLDTLLAFHHIEFEKGSFLNIDVQGAELMVLQGMGKQIEQFDHAYIEVNDRHLYRGCPLVGEIDEFMTAAGFAGVEVKMMRQGWGDKYYRRA